MSERLIFRRSEFQQVLRGIQKWLRPWTAGKPPLVSARAGTISLEVDHCGATHAGYALSRSNPISDFPPELSF